MQAAVPVGEGAMAAILGLELDAVEEVAAAASAAGVCDVANDNAPGQVVVSGARGAVERAVELAKAQGRAGAACCSRSARRSTAGCWRRPPTRCAAALAGIALRPPAVPLITNVTAAPESDPAALAALLVEQVTARVRWREVLLTMAARGRRRDRRARRRPGAVRA